MKRAPSTRAGGWLPAALAALLAACAAPPARALCVGPVCSCTLSTSPVAFGTVNPLAAGATLGVGNVRMSCGGVAGLLIPYRIDLGPGASGNVGARRLYAGANTLAYNLYSDAARSTVWGDGSAGSPVNGSILLDVLGLSPAVNHAVYGRIPSGQTSTVPGSYGDTVTVTLTYY